VVSRARRPQGGGGGVSVTTIAAPHRRTDTSAAAVLGAAVIALYVPVFRELFAIWINGTYYSYGFLVPLFSAYLVLDALRDAPRRSGGARAAELDTGGVLIIAPGRGAPGAGVAPRPPAPRTPWPPGVSFGA